MQAFNNVIGFTLVVASALATLPAQEAQASGTQPQNQEGVISQSEGDRASRLTLRLKDRDLRDVVQSIRRKTNANIIMAPGIEEAVTIDLHDIY